MNQPDDARRFLEPLQHPDRFLDDRQKHWLEPVGWGMRILQRILHGTVIVAMRLLFRLRISGLERLPLDRPFVLAPNHSSTLDSVTLAAVLPYRVLRRTRWAARDTAVLSNPILKLINRVAGTIPLRRDPTALAVASAVLERGGNLVWFPEGTRTATGRLQSFKPGIGALLVHRQAVVVPVLLQGTFDAWPRSHRWPQLFRTLRITFGDPLTAAGLSLGEPGVEEECRAAAALLRQRVAELSQTSTDRKQAPGLIEAEPAEPREK